jgi:hypothetical protein
MLHVWKERIFLNKNFLKKTLPFVAFPADYLCHIANQLTILKVLYSVQRKLTWVKSGINQKLVVSYFEKMFCANN